MKNLIFLIFLIFSFSVCAETEQEKENKTKNTAFVKKCYTDRDITNVDDFKKYTKTKYKEDLWETFFNHGSSISELKKAYEFLRLYGNDPCIGDYMAVNIEYSEAINAQLKNGDYVGGDHEEFCKNRIKMNMDYLLEEIKKSKAVTSL